MLYFKIYRKMSISQDELQKISKKLSKIPANNPELLENVTDILSYMDLLQEVDTTWVQPTVSVVDGISHLREDEQQTSTATPEELLRCSQQKVVAKQIILPNIMNK